MAVTQEEIIEALKEDNSIISGIMPTIEESEAFKTILDTRTTNLVKTQIDDKVKEIYGNLDSDMFSILGEKPGTSEDGKAEKTYSKIKDLYSELKTLRGQKDSLTKDAEVKRLNDEIEKLKNSGGAEHYKNMYESAKSDWETQKQSFETQIQNLSKSSEDFKKNAFLQSGLNQLKFNPDVKDSIKNLVIKDVTAQLMNSAEVKDGEIYFKDKDGKIILGKDHNPISAIELLTNNEAIKDIVLTEKKPGGGANPDIKGSIQTKQVEGKDVKTLSLPANSFKTRVEFQEVAKKALAAEGITSDKDEYYGLIDSAYKEYEVSKLPIE